MYRKENVGAVIAIVVILLQGSVSDLYPRRPVNCLRIDIACPHTQEAHRSVRQGSVKDQGW